MSTTHESTDRVVLVSGGNRGLGLATARLLARSGATVILGSRERDAGEQAAESLRDAGGSASAVTLDVRSDASVRAAVSEVERTHGRLDVLVNNAGVLPEATRSRAGILDLGLFDETLSTNVRGAAALTSAALPLLVASPAGRIVNVSSRMGSLADQLDPSSPYAGMVVPAYQVSKAALNALTVVLSKALADTRVKVNSVCPGWVQTDLGGDANRAAAPTSPDEAARVVARLALIDDDGPTGGFFDADGVVPW